jgi:hypothetical protein
MRNTVRHSGAAAKADEAGVMAKQSRQHTSEEFGRAPSSGSATAGMDAPGIGAPGMIMVDALVEEQSGGRPSTEPPPQVTVGQLGFVWLAMFVIAVAGVTIAHFVFHVALTFTPPS